MEFESKLSSVRVGNNISEKKLSENITKVYKSREEVINFFNDYFKRVHKAKYDAKHAIGLKILTHKQMLQRLSIALPQVKVGNTIWKFTNEIRQIRYCLY